MSGKISQQPVATNLADADILLLVQASTATTKAITWANMVVSIKAALSWTSLQSTIAGIISTLSQLGAAAFLGVGTSSSSVCAGNDARLSNSRQCNNTFDNASLARSNLGLGSAAQVNTGTTSGLIPVLDANGHLAAAQHGSGTPDGTKFLRDDLSWQPVTSIPVGAVIAVASEAVPTGYLECNGAAISRSTYAALFSATGIIHGQGDGASTFNLPDYRGRFLRGWAHGQTIDPDKAARTAMATGGQTGDHVGSVQADVFKNHTHQIPGDPYGEGAGGGNVVNGPSGGGASIVTSSSGGNETRPVNAGVMFCIKY